MQLYIDLITIAIIIHFMIIAISIIIGVVILTKRSRRNKFREFLCFIFGHRWIIASRITFAEHGRSQRGHMLCSRCREQECYQYDE